MKKLITSIMIAFTAVAAFGGACGEAPVQETAWVYRWTFTGKTTGPKQTKVKLAANPCGEPLGETCAVRIPTSLKIQGYSYICSPTCENFKDFAEVNEIFWSTKPGKYSLAGGVISDVVNVIGKDMDKAEVAGTANLAGDNMTYAFTYAGIGKYDKKNGRIKYIKGNFAGTADPCECINSAVWDCTTGTLLCGETTPTVVYGKWKVKFSKKYAKKYLNGKLPAIPSWVKSNNG